MTRPWGEPPTVDAPTLASLGAQDLSTEQLAALASYLRTLASWLDELRFLELERRHRVLERIGNRPALGYYRRLLQKQSAESRQAASVPPIEMTDSFI